MSELNNFLILASNVTARKNYLTAAKLAGLTYKHFLVPEYAEVWSAFENALEGKRSWSRGVFASLVKTDAARTVLANLSPSDKLITAKEAEELAVKIIAEYNLYHLKILAKNTILDLHGFTPDQEFGHISNGLLEMAKRATELNQAKRFEDPDGTKLANTFSEDLETKWKMKQEGKRFAIPTGLDDLDEAFGGGWRKNNLILVGGRTGGGKTQFAVNSAYNAWMEGFKVLFFSCEMTSNQIIGRICSRFTNIDNKKINAVDLDNPEFDRITHFNNRLQDNKLLIYQDFDNNVGNIQTIIDREVRLNRAPDLVIIDYAQYLNPVVKSRETIDNMRSIANTCKDIAIRYPVCVMLLCQLNRDFDDTAGPEMRNIASCDAFGQNCDGAVLIHSSKEMRESKAVQLRLRKMRYGVEGDHFVGANLAVSKFTSLDATTQTGLKQKINPPKEPKATKKATGAFHGKPKAYKDD